MLNTREYQDIQKEIKIKNVLKYLLKKSKSILIGTLIFTIITTVGGYAIDYKEYIKQKESVTESGEVEPTKEQKVDIEKVKKAQKKLNVMTEYNDNILLNTFDYNDVHNVMMEYKIDCTDSTIRLMAANMYYDYIQYGQLKDDIKIPKEEEEGQYYKITNDVIDSYINVDGSLLRVNVKGKDEIQAEEFASQIEKLLIEYRTEVSSCTSAHDIVLVQKQETVEFDQQTYRLQQEYAYWKTNAQQEYDDLVGLTETSLVEYAENENSQEFKVVKPSIKAVDILFGILVGIFVMCIFWMLEYMLSTRIKDADDIESIADISCLGMIGTAVNSEQRDLIKDKLSNIKKAIVVSAIDDRQYVQDLLEQLELKSDVYVCENSDITNDEKFIGAENVIIIEKENLSNYEKLKKNIIGCVKNNKNIVGYIYIEG